MRIQWFGQSAFLLSGEQTVFIDPFGVPGEAMAARGLEFNYAPIANVIAASWNGGTVPDAAVSTASSDHIRIAVNPISVAVREVIALCRIR